MSYKAKVISLNLSLLFFFPLHIHILVYLIDAGDDAESIDELSN